ncbi:Beta-glucosidase BoGH3B [Linum perenne]
MVILLRIKIRDPQLVRRIGVATAVETRATGVQYVFAPTIAVCRDPRWGRCYESYSVDPNIVRAITDIIPGLQGHPPANSTREVPFVATGKHNVVACAKHYVGDGGTIRGIDENDTIISWNELMHIHMVPYVSAIDKGFVISDFFGIDKLTDPIGANYTYSVEAGIRAGIDMVMIPYNYSSFILDLTSLEHRELAREAVRKSLVLLKNGKSSGDKPMLPLPKKAPLMILVAGSHSNNLGNPLQVLHTGSQDY